MHLEILITYALLIHSDPLDRKHSVIFAQPSRVQLVVWHHPPETNPKSNCRESSGEEEHSPWFNGRTMNARADRNPVPDKAADSSASARG